MPVMNASNAMRKSLHFEGRAKGKSLARIQSYLSVIDPELPAKIPAQNCFVITHSKIPVWGKVSQFFQEWQYQNAAFQVQENRGKDGGIACLTQYPSKNAADEGIRASGWGICQRNPEAGHSEFSALGGNPGIKMFHFTKRFSDTEDLHFELREATSTPIREMVIPADYQGSLYALYKQY